MQVRVPAVVLAERADGAVHQWSQAGDAGHLLFPARATVQRLEREHQRPTTQVGVSHSV